MNTQDFPGFKAGDDHYIDFDGPWTSLVKTITMFVGELEFSDIPIDPESKLSWLAFSFLVTFVFLIVVILMNLLNGLAVSDTGLIMEQAEIVSYISRVETISHLESVLLGDPFDFLTNWPQATFLATITNLDVKVRPPALKPQSVDNFYEAGQGRPPLSNKNVSLNMSRIHCLHCFSFQEISSETKKQTKNILMPERALTLAVSFD